MYNRLKWSTTASVFLALACAEPAPELTSNPDLKVYSWWKTNGEKAAFDALVTPFKLEHPGAAVENVYRENSATARDDLGRLLLLGTPPSTFQTNAGADLLGWAAVDYEPPVGEPAGAAVPAEQGVNLLADLGPLLRETGALDAMYPEVRRGVCARVGGQERYFAVPVNVHRINLLYYNLELVNDLGVVPEELFTLENLCPADLASERLPFRISIADTDNFSLLLLTFENLLLAFGGPSLYVGFFAGEPPSSWRTEMERVLGCLWYLSQSFKDVGHWSLAVNDVATGQAHVTVMGDWATPELAAALGNAAPESVVGRMPFPHTADYFAYTSDGFPQPLEAGSPEHTEALLRTFTAFDTQVAFSAAKGSIPALRRAGAPAISDAWALESLEAFESADKIKVLANSGFFPSYVSEARISEELLALIDVETVSDVPAGIRRVLDLLESNLPLFRTWRRRLELCD